MAASVSKNPSNALDAISKIQKASQLLMGGSALAVIITVVGAVAAPHFSTLALFSIMAASSLTFLVGHEVFAVTKSLENLITNALKITMNPKLSPAEVQAKLLTMVVNFKDLTTPFSLPVNDDEFRDNLLNRLLENTLVLIHFPQLAAPLLKRAGQLARV